MTTDRPQRSLTEIRAELRKFERAQRDERIRQGRATPRTYREMQIFGEHIRDLTERGRASEDGEDGSPDCVTT